MRSAVSQIETIDAVWHAIDPEQRTILLNLLSTLRIQRIRAARQGIEYESTDILAVLENILRRSNDAAATEDYENELSRLLTMLPTLSEEGITAMIELNQRDPTTASIEFSNQQYNHRDGSLQGTRTTVATTGTGSHVPADADVSTLSTGTGAAEGCCVVS